MTEFDEILIPKKQKRVYMQNDKIVFPGPILVRVHKIINVGFTEWITVNDQPCIIEHDVFDNRQFLLNLVI